MRSSEPDRAAAVIAFGVLLDSVAERRPVPADRVAVPGSRFERRGRGCPGRQRRGRRPAGRRSRSRCRAAFRGCRSHRRSCRCCQPRRCCGRRCCWRRRCRRCRRGSRCRRSRCRRRRWRRRSCCVRSARTRRSHRAGRAGGIPLIVIGFIAAVLPSAGPIVLPWITLRPPLWSQIPAPETEPVHRRSVPGSRCPRSDCPDRVPRRRSGSRTRRSPADSRAGGARADDDPGVGRRLERRDEVHATRPGLRRAVDHRGSVEHDLGRLPAVD
jgi:hypothetical protein